MNTLDRINRLIKHYGGNQFLTIGERGLHGILNALDLQAKIVTTGGYHYEGDGRGTCPRNYVGTRVRMHENRLGGTGKFNFWLGSEG